VAEENRLTETHGSLERPPEPRPLFYILSFFLPAGGLVLAALFMGRAEEDHRRFGQRCLIAVLILVGVYTIFLVCYTIFIIVIITTRLPSLHP